MQPILHPESLSPWQPGMLALVVFAAVVLVLAAILMFVSAWLGERKHQANKGIPYESGIIPTGTARLHYPIPFFLVAIFFLIFDVEGAFIFSWAVAWKRLGWTGWLQITFFITVLIAGLVYIWRKGGLEWGPRSNRK